MNPYDSKKHKRGSMCTSPKGMLIFEQCPKADFPYIDLDDHCKDIVVIVGQTVRKSFKGFTQYKMKWVVLACKA
jgi:hypothetical protein